MAPGALQQRDRRPTATAAASDNCCRPSTSFRSIAAMTLLAVALLALLPVVAAQPTNGTQPAFSGKRGQLAMECKPQFVRMQRRSECTRAECEKELAQRKLDVADYDIEEQPDHYVLGECCRCHWCLPSVSSVPPAPCTCGVQLEVGNRSLTVPRPRPPVCSRKGRRLLPMHEDACCAGASPRCSGGHHCCWRKEAGCRPRPCPCPSQRGGRWRRGALACGCSSRMGCRTSPRAR